MEIEYEIITGENIKKLDNGIIINRYSHIVKGAHIGKNVMIGEHSYIARTAVIEDNTRIQNYVGVWDGVKIGKDTFIGHNVCFTNNDGPRKRAFGKEFVPKKTIIGDNVTICANVTILSPCKIGNNCYIGPGSVVLKNVAAGEKKNGLIKGKTEKKGKK